jgi:hypothetical protein
MKKYIVGFLAGTVFAISATAFADDIQSLIGKKVQAEYTVQVNGKVLNTVVVEGKNYAPVRAIGEAAGYSVVVDGKKVILNSEVKAVDGIKSLSNPTYTVEQINYSIKSAQENVDRYTLAVNTSEEAIKKETDQSRIEQFTVLLDAYKQQLAEAQELLDKWQTKLAELQTTP